MSLFRSQLICKAHPPIELPLLAIGTWSWGDVGGTWGGAGTTKEKAALKEAWEEIVRGGDKVFLDTAEIYSKGASERIIGELRRNAPKEVQDRLVIATKWSPLPTPSRLMLPSGMVSALRASLERLGVEQVDLYQVHGPIHLFSFRAVGAALAQCVKLGLTKAVGVSNYSKDEMIKMHDILASHGIPLASNQIELSLLRRLPELSGLLAAAHERGIVPLAYSPLAMGRLGGRYSAANPPPTGRKFSNIPMGQAEPLLDVMREIAERRNVAVSAVALNYCISKGAIPLGGARNADQVKKNAQAVGWSLDKDEIARLEEKSFTGKTSWWWQHG